MSDAKYPRAFADEATPFAEAARDESLARIQPESDRWPLAHGMRTALARLAWESGWDSAIAHMRRPSLPGVVTLTGEEIGKIREAMLGARIYLCKCGCPTCDRCTAWKAINEALGIITRAQKEG